MNNENNKTCACCKSLKILEEFFNDKRSNDGKTGYCKPCVKKKQRTIRERGHELGIIKKGKERMSDEIKKSIIEYYKQGIGCLRISKLVGYSKACVLRYLQENTEMRHEQYRKYKFKNENYFDNINTEEKAYFLGLLWADGCNFRNEDDKKAYQVIISLQERDGDIIKRLCNEIYENEDIIRLIDPNLVNHKHPSKRQKQYSFRIPSKHISNVLLKYGMEPRKSFTLEIPKNIEFDENLWRAFIRGYYDGDGGISLNNNSLNYVVGLISSISFCKNIKDIIYKYSGIEIQTELLNKYSQPMMNLKIHGNNKSEKFLDWLYQNSTIHLSRKYDKYLLLKQLVIKNSK